MNFVGNHNFEIKNIQRLIFYVKRTKFQQIPPSTKP